MFNENTKTYDYTVCESNDPNNFCLIYDSILSVCIKCKKGYLKNLDGICEVA